MHREIFLAEVFGTGALVLLGDAVVAGVLLNRSKAQNSGWIVITMAWAFAVFVGVIIAGPFSGAHLNPAVTLASGAQRRDRLGPRSRLLGGRDARRVPRRGAGVPPLLPALGGDGGRRPQACRLQHGAGDPQPPRGTSGQRAPRHVRADVRDLHLRPAEQPWPPQASPRSALPVAFLVLVIGLALGGTTGYAINPARDLGPRIAHFLLPIPGKRDSDWGTRGSRWSARSSARRVAYLVYNLAFANFIVIGDRPSPPDVHTTPAPNGSSDEEADQLARSTGRRGARRGGAGACRSRPGRVAEHRRAKRRTAIRARSA